MDQIWDRIQNYRAELADVCESVNQELETNRVKRDRWYVWSDGWKSVWAPWLGKPGQSDKNDP